MHRPMVIYHGNCADGFSAAWCFWRKYRDGADYVAGVYQQEPPDVTGRDVYLVDFSYKRAVVERMLAQARSVCLIDHHKTAIEDLQPLFMRDSWTGEPKQLAHFTDLNRSGATLAWDYLFPEEDRPLLLGHIEDRDLWRFKLTGTREIQAFVFSHEYTFEQWDRLMLADQLELLKMTAAGAAIERKHHKDVAELLNVCKRRMVIGGHDVPVASLPYTLVIDADHNIVAECCADIRRAGEDAREEALANARLYAAAPDLLDALQYAMPYLKAAVPSPRNGINPDCTQDVNCVDRALAAIAKATGERS